MLFRIDPSAPEPIYAQIAAQVRSAAARGEVGAGERLPAARDLAESLQVNLHTVLRAYQDLRDAGLIELRRGRGAVVSAGAGRDLTPLTDAVAAVAATARRLGVPPDTTLALVREALR
ncbi:GntR family transcriptional regulator [Actinotalea fermentans]|uniref:GntR family transcriptional regulator n=1 Tax=Actinotalea fermentans TaxID=43671 RepID=A0A511YW31_9CELL|nr:GntR family transcriptional regulator [Actinotalea fermentans]KGM17411.1 GntR family transcriptional regulator [Actinotalea fermentans ATCC 43279 = JCM 9966 = DSM 3133]GEN79408.1 GntR family transcriptional regulator [Actinotalea fermentans]